MFELKPCCRAGCKGRGVRFLASSEAPDGAWYCYSHSDEIEEEK